LRSARLILALVVIGVVGLAAAPAQAKRRRAANMPDGFVWPPTAAMREAGRRCREDLDLLGVRWSPGRAQRRIVTPVVLPEMRVGSIALTPTYRKGPFAMDCHLARALAGKATALAALGIVELRFSTIHEYRRIRVRRKGRLPLSRHALGLAIDVYEIVTADGRRLVVEKDYRREPLVGAVEALFAADPEFRGPLSPGTAPRSHRDHLHLEARQGQLELEARRSGGREDRG
jgi:hypothetical protein